MKNQYVGDINDYQKYDLLQLLSRKLNLKILVVWMLTQNDGSTDGRNIKFLDNKKKYYKYNKELFDELYSIVKNNKRNVKEIEKLPSFTDGQKYEFMSEFLDKTDRKEYFKIMNSKVNSAGIVFFDPDTGMEPKTQKGSPKHLYWMEVKDVIERGKDVLFIQFYNRFKGNKIDFVKNKINECVENLKLQKERIVPFHGKNVVFIYISHDGKDLSQCVCEWEKRWL